MGTQRLDPVTLGDIQKAKERLRNVITPSPVVSMELLNMKIKQNLYFKAESLLPVGSFKLRGAYNKIAAISEEKSGFEVITASAGNHAMGVSYACKILNQKATVVVPKTAPKIKKETCQALGATVIEYGENYNDAYSKAREIEKEYGTRYVHPVADTEVIAGQGTIGLEIMEQLPDVQQVIVPLGGGGLAVGIAAAVKSINPKIRVIAIQPSGSAVFYQTIKEKKTVVLDQVNTIADGLSNKKAEPFLLDQILQWVDDVYMVQEESIKRAIVLQLMYGKILVEGAGAAPLAAVIEDQIDCRVPTVLVSTGSNIDSGMLRDLLDDHLDE
ncbi:threonine ammonia-lyase [Ammoniphilus resinae]|uniref:Threonine dehydratase n=1 Tax=Ammoniphilus resinae TaxID=861532 RepID=A0ABS4GTN4_9BACL|nr:threonine dehydratase [Ammoniphilus resinae]